MLFLAPLSGPLDVLDASLAAHAALKRYRAHITLDSRSSRKRLQTTYDLAVDGSTVLLRVRQPRANGLERSDRTLLFGPSRLVAYDAVANERLTRALPKGASRLERMVFILGPLDDMLRNVLNPSDLKTFYAGMRRLTGWTLKKGPTGTVVSRQAHFRGGFSKVSVMFGAGKPLLRRFDISSVGNEVHWTFDYSAGGPVSFTPPRGATEVASFTVAPQPPHYASQEAQRVTKAMLAAYRRYTRGTVDVDGDDGHVRIFLDGRRLREEQPGLSYAYDGKALTILDRRRNAFYRGAAIRSTVPELVAEIGGRSDPLSRQILQHRVPYQEILGPQMTVAVAGQMSSGATTCDILRLSRATSRVSMFVRRDNHLVESVTSDVLDAHGRSMASSTRSFRYGRLGAVSFSIAPKAGQRVLPLPKLKLDFGPPK